MINSTLDNNFSENILFDTINKKYSPIVDNMSKMLFMTIHEMLAIQLNTNLTKPNQDLLKNKLKRVAKEVLKQIPYENNNEEYLSQIQNLTNALIKKDEVLLNLSNMMNSINLNQTQNSNHMLKENNIEPEDIDLRSIYLSNKKDFENWISNKKYSNDTITAHKSKCKLIFEDLKIKNSREFNEYFEKTQNRTNINFRMFIKYCKSKGLIKLRDYDYILKDVSGTIRRKGVDRFIPTEEEIKKSLIEVNNVVRNPPKFIRKEVNELYLLFYKLSIESGCRIISIKRDVFENFDIKRLKQFGDISTYEMNKEETNENDNKLALFLFCRTKTMNKILEYYEKGLITPSFLNYFEEDIVRWTNKKAVHLKYHRKFLRTLMIKNDVKNQFAEFIQSRLSEMSVGMKHYSEHLNQSVVEYQKVIPSLNKIMEVIEND